MTVSFDVVGVPAPQGSKRHVGKGVMVESSKAVKPWRSAVAAAAAEAMRGREPFVGRPLALRVTFVFVRPAGHYGKRGLKPSARTFPSVKPDLSKLVRSTEDALTGIVWDDDSRVVETFARKVYAAPGDAPGAVITVEGWTCV